MNFMNSPMVERRVEVDEKMRCGFSHNVYIDEFPDVVVSTCDDT